MEPQKPKLKEEYLSRVLGWFDTHEAIGGALLIVGAITFALGLALIIQWSGILVGPVGSYSN